MGSFFIVERASHHCLVEDSVLNVVLIWLIRRPWLPLNERVEQPGKKVPLVFRVALSTGQRKMPIFRAQQRIGR